MVLNQKSKVLESWKLVKNEKKGSTKLKIKLRRLKLVQHCIQLIIAKHENFSKRVPFLVYDSMVDWQLLYYLWNFVFVYTSHIIPSKS